jgi:hypothetical protein
MVQNTPFYKRASFQTILLGAVAACVGLFLSIEAVLTPFDPAGSVYAGLFMGMGLAFTGSGGGFRHFEKELESKQGN